MSACLRPSTLREAIAALAAPGLRVLAGGTDLYPATQAADLHGRVIDLGGLRELRGVTRGPDGLRIGACTTWTDILRADVPPALTALQQAARQVGGWQIQNAGTLGGNLCNASPAADGVPPLLACDAVVELAGGDGSRGLALADFITGPRQTALRPGEIVTAILLPQAALTGRSVFLKLGARAHLVISLVMVAARVEVRDGRVAAASLAVGSASPVARRLPQVEAALVGMPASQAAAAIDAGAVAAALSPIDDIRATAAYRATAAATLLRRAVAGAVA
ncbi:MAG: FAD binding domain-containing protein [Gemmobacter sp.]